MYEQSVVILAFIVWIAVDLCKTVFKRESPPWALLTITEAFVLLFVVLYILLTKA